MNKIASELVKAAKTIAAGKPGEFIEAGDKVAAKTRKGMRDLVLVGYRTMRGRFRYELKLAEPAKPDTTWTWKVNCKRIS